MSAACYLAKAGMDVHVFEKNAEPGGRARKFEANGYTFDMGPSWYWMPDVFDRFFANFGKQTSDYYDLVRLDPSYRVYFDNGNPVDLPASFEEMKKMFESWETDAGQKLEEFMADAEYKYDVGINRLVYKPSEKISEFLDKDIILGTFKLQLFNSISSLIKSYFSHPKIIQLLEFPVLFLGAKPEKTPALYSLMNYADIKLGTWYPMKGMHQIAEAMYQLACELGVNFHFNSPVSHIPTSFGRVLGVQTPDGLFESDFTISGADYHHTETKLLPQDKRNYSDKYWNSRTMAPSSLLFYLGLNKKVANLLHHNLFFDASFGQHAVEIYDEPQWPSNPLFYVCAPSVTDSSVAPEGHENIFILMPIAPGLNDDEETREKYFNQLINRLEKHTGEDLQSAIDFKRSYAVKDFISDYNSFKGNAYGLANTLKQTAILKPKLRSKSLNNLFYTGQLTTPGPGVPPSLISGQVVADLILKETKKITHESLV